MFADLMIGAHFSISPAMNFFASSGVPPASSTPSWSRNFRACSDFRYSLVAALSLAMTSGGVPAGAITAYQTLASKPGRPDSDAVGTLGRPDQRLRPAIASALILPAWMLPT